MTFTIDKPYEIVRESIPFERFLDGHYLQADIYNSVRLDEYSASRIWQDDRKRVFLDAVLRRRYVSPIVLLEKPDSTREILDGWQRVNVIRDFQYGKIPIPQSLGNVPQFQSLIGRKFTELLLEIRVYMCTVLTLNADIIKGITNAQEIHRLFFDLHPGYIPRSSNACTNLM